MARAWNHKRSDRAASVQSRCGLGMMPTRPRSRRSASQQACSVGAPSVNPSVRSQQASQRNAKLASFRCNSRPRIDRARSKIVRFFVDVATYPI